MCDHVVPKDPFMLKYFLDRYKTKEMCDKAVDKFLPALKFVPDWFVTGKIIIKLHNALFEDDNILFLMKILEMSYFPVMKWLFLMQILIIITLKMLIG